MSAALAVLLAGPLPAAAWERPPMPKSAATVVAVGTVREVFTSGAGTARVKRITLLEVESVERGEGPAAGGFLHIHTSENQLAYWEVGASGHKWFRIPGAKLRVWLTVLRDGLATGLYPDWYEEIPPPNPWKDRD